MVNIKIKFLFSVALILTLLLGVGLVSASEVDINDKVSFSDNTNSLMTTSNNDNIIDDVKVSNENNDEINNLPATTNSGSEGVKSSNDVLNFSSLNETINSGTGDLIELEHNYTFDSATDARFIGTGIRVDRDLTIDGKGHTIDCAGQLRFISTWGHHLTLKNITIINGYDQWNGGGAVAIWGDASNPAQGTFIDTVFSNIEGCAVYIVPGTGTFTRSTFTNCNGSVGIQGSAVHIEGQDTLLGQGTFEDCVFDQNKATQGAVYISGIGNFNNCNFTNNEGAIGGALRIMGNVTFTNTRFSNNKALGDWAEGGAASIVGQATITDSIFDGNQGPTGGALVIYGDGSSFTRTTFNDNTATSYGGAVAIWGNNNTFIEVKSNRNNVTAGIGGALFIQGNDTNIKDSAFDGNIAGTNGGAVYIINGEDLECYINIVNSNFTNNKADFANGLGGAVYAKGCTFVDSCIFSNNGANNGGAFRAWNFASINNTKFDANYAINDGGAASINGYANITNSIFNGNEARKCGALSLYSQNDYATYLDYLNNNIFTSNIANGTYGGAVAIWGQNIQFTNNNLTNNKAVSKGGAVYIYGNASIINSILNENEAEDGGAIFLNGTASITNSAFNMNQAKFRGGAIFLNGTGNIMASNFTNNGCTDSEDGNGAAVRIQNGDCTIVDAIISDNHAGYNGGAISALLANVTIENSTLDANTALYGGAVYVYGGIGNFVNVLFTNNTASGKDDSTGGAVHIEDGTGSFNNVSFIDNECVNGGAVGILGNGTFVDSTFTNNVAYNHGGAVSIVGNGVFNNTNFSMNNANYTGGAVYVKGNVNIDKCSFENNSADIASALFVNNDCNITNSILANNTGVKNEYAIIHNIGTFDIDDATVRDSEQTSLWCEYATMEVQPSEFIGGKTGNITCNVTCIDDTKVNNGEISVLEDGEKIATGQIISGIGTIIIENLTPGVHTLKVCYKGENDYTEIINEINVTVKDAVNMGVSVNNITYGQDATILINFDNINVTGVAYIVYGGHQYPTTITTGIGSITIPGLNAGNYNFEVIFESDDYHADNANAIFTVDKKASSIAYKTAAFVINYAGTYQITVNVPIANIPVTFTLNGKKIATAKTSASGIVKITLTAAQLKTAGAGTRDLVINYAGNENYKPATETAKITIKKENTKFANVKSVKSSYKRTAKSMQLTATLKDSKNKVIKNQYVTFKVNNKKSYKVKTNVKGVATLTLNLANIKACKLNKKGTYKFTVTYPVSATYNIATANGKLKVIN